MVYMQLDKLSALIPAIASLTETKSVARFSALEWSVIALSRNDGVWTLREPGRVSQAMGALFGHSFNPRLADKRLEALRRTAIMARQSAMPLLSEELDAFIDAGFSRSQYDLLAASIACDLRH